MEMDVDGGESPLLDLPPLAVAAVAAGLSVAPSSSSRSPTAWEAATPQPAAGSGPAEGMANCTPDWLHFSASSGDEDSPRSSLARLKGKQIVSSPAIWVGSLRRRPTGASWRMLGALLLVSWRMQGVVLRWVRRSPSATPASHLVLPLRWKRVGWRSAGGNGGMLDNRGPLPGLSRLIL